MYCFRIVFFLAVALTSSALIIERTEVYFSTLILLLYRQETFGHLYLYTLFVSGFA